MKSDEYLEINKEASKHCSDNYGKTCATGCKLKVLCKEYNENYHTDNRDTITKQINDIALSWSSKTTKKPVDVIEKKVVEEIKEPVKQAKVIQRTSDSLF